MRNRKWQFTCLNWSKRLFSSDLLPFDKVSSLGSDSVNKLRSRFVVQVLRHQLAAHRQVQDRLTQLLDLVRRTVIAGNGLVRSGVVAEGLGIGSLSRARLAVVSRSRVASVRSASCPAGCTTSSTRRPWLRRGAARRGAAAEWASRRSSPWRYLAGHLLRLPPGIAPAAIEGIRIRTG